jgi:hypothetical protein
MLCNPNDDRCPCREAHEISQRYLLPNREVVWTHHAQSRLAGIDKVGLQYFIVRKMADRIFHLIIRKLIAVIRPNVRHGLYFPSKRHIAVLFRIIHYNRTAQQIQKIFLMGKFEKDFCLSTPLAAIQALKPEKVKNTTVVVSVSRALCMDALTAVGCFSFVL